MSERSSTENDESRGDAASSANSPDRRDALSTGSSLLMAGGLLGGYGTFFTMAAKYLFSSDPGKAWMFVASAETVAPGASIDFQSPVGVRVSITRDSEQAANPPTAENFLALSSVCPHLGCRVHWEPQNNRHFCPCHNGVFDPQGHAVSGPPAKDGQNLSSYPLMIVDGALYIEMPYRTV